MRCSIDLTRWRLRGFTAISLLLWPAAASLASEVRPIPADFSPAAVAAEVDRFIRAALVEEDAMPAPPATDVDFLRRVSLDLAGRIPTLDEINQFESSTEADKRASVIDRLLESEGFAETWASYWRDVIFSRATDERSRRAERVLEAWLEQELAANRPWDQIVTELLIATGDTTQDGRAAFMFAHGGDPAELAGETSRIFLGIQIQCANCHDHPYDSWTRENFHELAAFFPRVRVRRDQSGEKPKFVVESVDHLRDEQANPLDPTKVFKMIDRDHDGLITEEEAAKNKNFKKQFGRLIALGDEDGNKLLSLEEYKSVRVAAQTAPGRKKAEYYMPDLVNPSEPGTRTQPVSFLDDRSVPFGTKDVDRRSALAASIVAPENPWFARAFVNRTWAEMLGEGFYMPVDDLGPQREAHFPEVLEVLSAGFVVNHYDIKWLYRSIALTEAYQRSLHIGEASEGIADQAAFSAMSPTRLRSDQIYNSLIQILRGEGTKKEIAERMKSLPLPRNEGGRALFASLFNYDPSTPQEDLTGTIPQALFMMNSPVTNAAARAHGKTFLAHTLRNMDDDSAVLNEIYLRVLARKPTEAELEICRQHLATVGNRAEAFEDILWCLLNSSEFLTKR